MKSKSFWKHYTLPTQDEFLDIEEINPAEAYRRQADAINLSGPIYAELEVVEEQLRRVLSLKKSLRTKILASNMPMPSSSTRTNDLVDAFVLSCAKNYKTEEGGIKDITNLLLKLDNRESVLHTKLSRLERRLKALEAMADKCDRIMNWAKHEARLESK